MVKKSVLSLSFLIMFILFLSGCNRYNWNEGVYLNNAFSDYISEEAYAVMRPLLDTMKKDGVPDEDNRICVDLCRFYNTSENNGYYIKYYRHIMANDCAYFEVYWYNSNETIMIDSSSDAKYSNAICDGKKLYYVNSDGFLLCADKNSSITKLSVFGSNINIGYITLNGEDNKLYITPCGNKNKTVEIDISTIA